MSVQQSTESGGSGGTEERPTAGPDGTGTEGDQPTAVQEENAAAEPDGTPAAGAKPARKKRPFWQELPILLVILHMLGSALLMIGATVLVLSASDAARTRDLTPA